MSDILAWPIALYQSFCILSLTVLRFVLCSLDLDVHVLSAQRIMGSFTLLPTNQQGQTILDVDGLQSIPGESNDKDVVAILDELTILEANEESFVIVLQHGGNDVTCKQPVGSFHLHLCTLSGTTKSYYFLDKDRQRAQAFLGVMSFGLRFSLV